MFEFIFALSRKQQIAAFCIVYVLWTADTGCRQLCKTSVGATAIQAWVKATKSGKDLYEFIFQNGIIGEYCHECESERRNTISISTVKNTWNLLEEKQYIKPTSSGFRLTNDPKIVLQQSILSFFSIYCVYNQSQNSYWNEFFSSLQKDVQDNYQNVEEIKSIPKLVDALNSQRITDSPQK